MLLIFLTIILFLASVASGYFSYFFLFQKENTPLGIAFAAIFALFFILAFITLSVKIQQKQRRLLKDANEKLNQWTKISYHVEQAGDEVFNHLPIGILLYDDTNYIVWTNGYASMIFSNPLGMPLESISQKFYDKLINDKETNIILNYKNKNYDIIHNVDDHIIYVFDVTEREKIKARYFNRVTSIGIISIDNLEESLSIFDVQQRSVIRGQIMQAIENWAKKFNCFLQSVDDDRMVFIVDQENLNKMTEDKFSVMNEIHEITEKNNRLKAFISMGVACYDNDYSELGNLANNAIELAERRGGDQIVVNIEGQSIQYFGGSANSPEKKDLGNVRQFAESIKDAVTNSSNVLLMCHNFADVDALGSMIAAYEMVRTSGKDCKMVFEVSKADVTVERIFQDIKKYPELSKNIIPYEEGIKLLTPETLLFITDTQSPSLVMFKELYSKAQRICIVDHHRAGDVGYSNYLTYYVDTQSSSATELLVEMFMFYSQDIKLTEFEASIMLAAIIVDTNNFTMRTRSMTFDACSSIREMGGDIVYVRQLLRESIDDEKMLSSAISRSEIYGDKFAIVTLGENEKIKDRTTLAKISDRLLTISGIDASFTIGRIDEDLVGISARSLGEVFNVQIVMEQMGGGGHYNSAAVQLKGISIEDVKEKLTKNLSYYFDDKGVKEMKVILLEDVKGKGKKNQIIDVPNGFGNFLIANKKAMAATEENQEKVAEEIKVQKNQEQERKRLLTKLKSDIDNKIIEVTIKLGANGKKFGNVSKTVICDEFEKKYGLHLNKKDVELSSDINSVGIYTVKVKLDTDIVAEFEVKVLEEKSEK